MASRPMVFLGEISYEIFLIHLVTMEIVMVEVLGMQVYTGSMLCAVRRDDGRDDSAGLAAAPRYAGQDVGDSAVGHRWFN